MGTRVAYCVDIDKSVIIGNFEKRGWVAGWISKIFVTSLDIFFLIWFTEKSKIFFKS